MSSLIDCLPAISLENESDIVRPSKCMLGSTKKISDPNSSFHLLISSSSVRFDHLISKFLHYDPA